MAKEYIEREAAKSEFNIHFGGVSHAVIASKILDEIPAADVVDVVRCKDCHLSCYVQGGIGESLFCTYWNRDTDEEGYCHEGW